MKFVWGMWGVWGGGNSQNKLSPSGYKEHEDDSGDRVESELIFL